jgi:hypothetical protein
MGKIYFSGLPNLDNFTMKNWFSGDFQAEFQNKTEDHAGFKNTLIRIRNQYDFSLFRMTNAGHFLAGRDNFLFSDEVIFEYTGASFIGKTAINRKVAELKDIIPKLKTLGIDLVPIILPGKASFFPEKIPAHFHPKHRSESNYDYFRKRFDQCKVPYLDLNHYFVVAKDTSRYPLYPKLGSHWNEYGMIKAVDSLMHYVGNIRQQRLPRIKIEKIALTDSVSYDDNDLGLLLNLYFPLSKARTPWIKYVVTEDPQIKKLKVLVISDSYYDLVQKKIASELFSKNDYWFYNDSHRNANDEAPDGKRVDKSDLLEVLKQYDVILLMCSEMNMHTGFFKSIDEIYTALNPGFNQSYLQRYEDNVRNDRDWFLSVLDKAHKTGHSLEQTITDNARFQFLTEYSKLKNKSREDSVEYIGVSMRFNPGQCKYIKEKAKKNNLSFDQMLRMDADYIYSHSKRNP